MVPIKKKKSEKWKGANYARLWEEYSRPREKQAQRPWNEIEFGQSRD